MSIKIVKEITSELNFLSGSEVTRDQILGLSNNLFAKFQRKATLGGRPQTMDPTKDTRTAYFDKPSLDQLFKDNPGSDGLKIFFGVHCVDIYPATEHQKEYENQLMAVLVTTTGGDKNENLNVDDKVMIAGSIAEAGTGMDNGKLCPPNPNC
jgi:hypothetical protein